MLAVLLASLGTAAPAKAVDAQLTVAGSNGHQLTVAGSEGKVSIVVNTGDSTAVYRVPGSVSRKGMWARFGRLGQIAIRFRASGSLFRKVPPRRCKGRPRITRFGSFVGTIRFVGERGYTKVNVQRARGRVHVPRRWKCKPASKRRGRSRCRPSDKEPKEQVILESGSLRGVELDVTAERSSDEPGFTLFSASSWERRGRIEIQRHTFVTGGERTFEYEKNLASATVSPPPPFSGTAVFQRNADRSTSWTGTLRVSLPGRPNIALTGRDTGAQLQRPVSEEIQTCPGGTFWFYSSSAAQRERQGAAHRW